VEIHLGLPRARDAVEQEARAGLRSLRLARAAERGFDRIDGVLLGVGEDRRRVTGERLDEERIG